ncbi:hypothetical protein WJX81_002948 [Elliptochloris bilobata]|uniref:Kinesin-like protein n=1 Tax=Elliptochloris bilobata TaxID=381761 RepID=A0AAW1SKK7_9CHLO
MDGDAMGGYLLRSSSFSRSGAPRPNTCKITRAAAEPVKTSVQLQGEAGAPAVDPAEEPPGSPVSSGVGMLPGEEPEEDFFCTPAAHVLPTPEGPRQAKTPQSAPLVPRLNLGSSTAAAAVERHTKASAELAALLAGKDVALAGRDADLAALQRDVAALRRKLDAARAALAEMRAERDALQRELDTCSKVDSEAQELREALASLEDQLALRDEQMAHAASSADEAMQAARNAGLQAGLAAAVLQDSLRATAAGALPSPGAAVAGFGRGSDSAASGGGSSAGGGRSGCGAGSGDGSAVGFGARAGGDGGLMQLCTRFAAAHVALQERYLEEAAARRALHNQLIDLKGAIRVFARVRPLGPGEAQAAGSAAPAVRVDAAVGAVEVAFGRVGGIAKDGSLSTSKRLQRFTFDASFGGAAPQAAVYAEVAPVVTSVLDAYNVCIFAYGQTGSGKTHTMEGPEGDRGVAFLTLADLFRIAAARRVEADFEISVYNEHLYDLLGEPCADGGRPRLEVHLGPGGAAVPGLTEAPAGSAEEAWALLCRGAAARACAETKANARSSRSHCLLRVAVSSRSRITGDVAKARLWLVDLAGSERLSRSEAVGERLAEAQAINRSLSALGDCIHALATRAAHVPFRATKLTSVLADSLSGDSKTVMLVAASPAAADAAETACSLAFAARVRGVELGAARRHVEAGGEIDALRAELASLRAQVKSGEADRAALAAAAEERGRAAAAAEARLRAQEKALAAAEGALAQERSLRAHHAAVAQARASGERTRSSAAAPFPARTPGPSALARQAAPSPQPTPQGSPRARLAAEEAAAFPSPPVPATRQPAAPPTGAPRLSTPIRTAAARSASAAFTGVTTPELGEAEAQGPRDAEEGHTEPQQGEDEGEANGKGEAHEHVAPGEAGVYELGVERSAHSAKENVVAAGGAAEEARRGGRGARDHKARGSLGMGAARVKPRASLLAAQHQPPERTPLQRLRNRPGWAPA